MVMCTRTDLIFLCIFSNEKEGKERSKLIAAGCTLVGHLSCVLSPSKAELLTAKLSVKDVMHLHKKIAHVTDVVFEANPRAAEFAPEVFLEQYRCTRLAAFRHLSEVHNDFVHRNPRWRKTSLNARIATFRRNLSTLPPKVAVAEAPATVRAATLGDNTSVDFDGKYTLKGDALVDSATNKPFFCAHECKPGEVCRGILEKWDKI